MTHLTPEQRSEIRRSVVAPFLDLSDITHDDRREDGGYNLRKQPMGRVQEVAEKEEKIAALKNMMAQVETDRESSANREIEKHAARIEMRRLEIVADYLAGYHESLIRQKFGINRAVLRNAVNAGTTADQRKTRQAKIHLLKVCEWQRVEKLRNATPKKIPLGEFRSLAAAARACGIAEKTARCYYRRRIPVSQWREQSEKGHRYRRKDHCIPVDGFPSISAAAAHADVSITTARRYFRMGLPVEQWAAMAERNAKEFQTQGCGQ